jgi:hypothetical protein
VKIPAAGAAGAAVAAFLLAALSAPAPGAGYDAPRPSRDKYDEAVQFLQLPNAAQSDLFRRRGGPVAQAAELLLDRSMWKEAFRRMDERTGLLSTTLIRVQFQDADLNGGREIGYVFLQDAAIHFWMPELAKNLEEDPDRARENFTGYAAHELTHVYQLNWYPNRMPQWLIEGMASFAGDQRWLLRAFPDGVPPLRDDLRGDAAYGRGLLFFLYLDAVYGRAAAVACIRDMILGDTPPRAAAAKIAGPDWAAREQAWAEAYVRDYLKPAAAANPG